MSERAMWPLRWQTLLPLLLLLLALWLSTWQQLQQNRKSSAHNRAAAQLVLANQATQRFEAELLRLQLAIEQQKSHSAASAAAVLIEVDASDAEQELAAAFEYVGQAIAALNRDALGAAAELASVQADLQAVSAMQQQLREQQQMLLQLGDGRPFTELPLLAIERGQRQSALRMQSIQQRLHNGIEQQRTLGLKTANVWGYLPAVGLIVIALVVVCFLLLHWRKSLSLIEQQAENLLNGAADETALAQPAAGNRQRRPFDELVAMQRHIAELGPALAWQSLPQPPLAQRQPGLLRVEQLAEQPAELVLLNVKADQAPTSWAHLNHFWQRIDGLLQESGAVLSQREAMSFSLIWQAHLATDMTVVEQALILAQQLNDHAASVQLSFALLLSEQPAAVVGPAAEPRWFALENGAGANQGAIEGGNSIARAAAMQRLNAELGCQYLMTAAAAEQLPADCLCRAVGEFCLSANASAEPLVELMLAEDELPAELAAWIEDFEQALTYWQQQDYFAAEQAWLSCLQQRPTDVLSSYYLQQCAIKAEQADAASSAATELGA